MCVGNTRLISEPRSEEPPQAAFKSAKPICPYSPQSLTCVSFWGFVRLPPSRNSNYLGYSYVIAVVIS
ncbi:hypothetical protein BVY05_02755 [Pectobacterium odoriferum]|nr:hypothetical protein BVY05_02755 [Pectobacterium odoriferum]